MRSSAYLGYGIGIIISILIILLLSIDSLHSWRVEGEFNVGHENLSCNECHDKATGSIQQQIQSNIQYLISERENVTTFNFEIPDNKDCFACHERDNDRHKVHRFNEPKFKKVRDKIQPQLCVSCHLEHNGVRVTAELDMCQHCHEKTVIKDDPIEVSHEDLVKSKSWKTCLGCHDFHGNHYNEPPTKLNKMIPSDIIKKYFEGGNDPYSLNKREKSKETRYEN